MLIPKQIRQEASCKLEDFAIYYYKKNTYVLLNKQVFK